MIFWRKPMPKTFYAIYADYIAHLPPYRQILTIDGDRPIGKPHDNKRYITFGQDEVINGRTNYGIYEQHPDEVHIKVQEKTDKLNPVPHPIFRSAIDIQGTISHEMSHQQDEQIPKIFDCSDVAGIVLLAPFASDRTRWSDQSQKWPQAIAQETASGNKGEIIQALLPDIKIRLHETAFQPVEEAKAEIEKLFCLAYIQMNGDYPETDQFMEKAYPHMWPVFRDEYLTMAVKVAAWLNPHIDLDAKPVGFGGAAAEVPQRNLNQFPIFDITSS